MTCASRISLAGDAVKAFRGIAVAVADRVTSFGTGLGDGTRRNMKQVRKSLRAFKDRRGMCRMLRCSRVKTDRLLRIGGISAMAYGQRELGVSI